MSLESIIKKINKDFVKDGNNSKPIIQFGVEESSTKETFSLGTPAFDFCTYNLIPRGIFIEVTGGEGSGKTTGAYLLASSYIRSEKLKPVENRQHILFVDAEHTAKPEWAKTSTGYDMNDKEVRTIYLSPQGESAEQIFDMVIECTKSGEIGLVIFDSLTAVAPQQVNSESLTKKDMGTMAKVMADFVRRATGLFARYNTTFIGINGTIMNISGYGNPETTGGGTYWRRACSLRLKFKQGDFFDENGEKLNKTAEDPKGHIIEMALLKSKFCRSDRRLGRCHLDYRRGIDVLSDTIDLAIHFGIIQNPSSGWYVMVNPTTNEPLLDENGKPVKINGKGKIHPYLETHLDLWRDIYNKVYEYIGRTDDPNIISFERMLGINIEEEFGVDLTTEAQ